MNDPSVLHLKNVCKGYRQAKHTIEVLRDISFELRKGEVVALSGPSGSGKSSFLNVAGLLEKPDKGTVRIAGQDTAALGDEQLSALRRDHMGFVYQFHGLLPEFNACENVALPLRINGVSHRQAVTRAREFLGHFGLFDRLYHHPGELSGGEQQRVSLVRALIRMPSLLLADEPTGNLDSENSRRVFGDLLGAAREEKIGVVVVTHNLTLAALAHRHLHLENGGFGQK